MGTAERPNGRGDLRAAGTVAFVGCGRMGAPMARRLLAAGAGVVAYDVDEHALAAVAEAGARAAASPRDAAGGAAFAVTMLPDPAVVERAARGPDGLLAGLEDGALWLEMSSSSPATTKALAAAAAGRGAALLDAPVPPSTQSTRRPGSSPARIPIASASAAAARFVAESMLLIVFAASPSPGASPTCTRVAPSSSSSGRARSTSPAAAAASAFVVAGRELDISSQSAPAPRPASAQVAGATWPLRRPHGVRVNCARGA